MRQAVGKSGITEAVRDFSNEAKKKTRADARVSSFSHLRDEESHQLYSTRVRGDAERQGGINGYLMAAGNGK